MYLSMAARPSASILRRFSHANARLSSSFSTINSICAPCESPARLWRPAPVTEPRDGSYSTGAGSDPDGSVDGSVVGAVPLTLSPSLAARSLMYPRIMDFMPSLRASHNSSLSPSLKLSLPPSRPTSCLYTPTRPVRYIKSQASLVTTPRSNW